MTLPTIPEIMQGVAAGDLTPERGAELVGEHMQASVDLDRFAGLAMQALMSDTRLIQEATNLGVDRCLRIATEAYAQASAMKNARP
jgi:hypothetical protein